MTAQEKLQDRKTRFEHAIRNDAPVGITPLYGNAMGWMVTDSPYTFHEAPYDMKINAEIFKGFAKKYDFDWYCDYGSWCVWKACRAIGHQVVEVSEDGLQYSVRDRHFMEDSEYAAFTRDPFLYRFQTALRRKCEGELTYGQLYDAVAAFREAGGYMDDMRHFLIEEMGSATVPNNYFTEPMEDFFTYYRGIRGLAVDLRRHKSELKQALDKLAANSLPVAIEMLDAQEPSDISACDTSFMTHTVMNSKQFAELYWPYFKQLADTAEAKDKILSIYLEGSSLGIKDFLQDLPKTGWSSSLSRITPRSCARHCLMCVWLAASRTMCCATAQRKRISMPRASLSIPWAFGKSLIFLRIECRRIRYVDAASLFIQHIASTAKRLHLREMIPRTKIEIGIKIVALVVFTHDFHHRVSVEICLFVRIR